MRYPVILLALLFSFAVSLSEALAQDAVTPPETNEIVVSATRLPLPQEETPAAVSVITAQNLEEKQIERVSDALRQVPGLSVVQSGAPGQLTSVFTRGLKSEHTQVLLDGIPINQGLAGLFNFADLTTDNIERIEVVRGPQSTLYGPRGLAGVIQIFTKQGSGPPSGSVSAEGGSYDTFHETLQTSGSGREFDYSLGASRLDTENARPNNQYSNSSGLANLGWSPNERLRVSSLFSYSLSDAGNPNTISNPKPFDNFLTERWLIAPHLDFKPVEWWEHKLILSYDHERQVNDPNDDGFVGPTRALFKRLTIDYQNDLKPAAWLTLTSGFFYSDVDAGQERPFVSQLFGPQPTFISDQTTETAGFLQAGVTPFAGLNLVAGGRYDHFNQFGGVWTYRFAGSYKLVPTDTTLHSSYATGFSPPTSQDKIFGNNFELNPEKVRGFDAGITQPLWNDRVVIGVTYFHNDLSNVIGLNGVFDTVNLGAARTQGIETELHARPIENLTLTATYTYLEAEKTSSADISQLPGARLPRRPRNEFYVSASYLWFRKLRTTAEAKFVNAREELNFGGPNFDIEDYSLVNLAAEYAWNSHLTIFGRVDNLTNEHYSEVFGFPALGRAAYGGVKLSF
ncbi:MAG: TonB-dependent receptor [Chthoniobacterales bacterium]|nr:TonB-dependent receptor [Chthoniobacterales bacterium]